MSRSMTGFARKTRGDLTLTLKSVNHRGLDFHFHLPPHCDAYEASLRTLLKEDLMRGSVQVRVEHTAGSAFVLNRALLETWLDTFHTVARELNLDAKPDLNQAFRLPSIFHQETAPESPALESELLALAREAVAEFNAFRDREGAAINAELQQRAGTITQIAARIAEIRTTAVQAFQQRLTTRLTELLSNTIDPQRLAHEAAILADRSDVSEELVRLQTHAAQLEKLIAMPGEKGKKLDFLLQEMNRETNTILSKTSGLGDIGLTVTDLALAAKSEIDKIREQSLNLE
jgi:uncharacterized protein (TIGR00255 family)